LAALPVLSRAIGESPMAAQTIWTQERLGVVRNLLVTEGLTRAAIAERVGVSKSSVIHAVQKYGWSDFRSEGILRRRPGSKEDSQADFSGRTRFKHRCRRIPFAICRSSHRRAPCPLLSMIRPPIAAGRSATICFADAARFRNQVIAFATIGERILKNAVSNSSRDSTDDFGF